MQHPDNTYLENVFNINQYWFLKQVFPLATHLIFLCIEDARSICMGKSNYENSEKLLPLRPAPTMTIDVGLSLTDILAGWSQRTLARWRRKLMAFDLVSCVLQSSGCSKQLWCWTGLLVLDARKASHSVVLYCPCALPVLSSILISILINLIWIIVLRIY